MDEAVGPRRKLKKRNIGERVSEDELLFDKAFLLPCDTRSLCLSVDRVRFEVPRGPEPTRE